MRDAASWLDDIDPGAGAVVMGTGIVALALALDNRRIASDCLLALASALWLGLALAMWRRVRRRRARASAQARTPAILTGIAATAVLGTGAAQLGWPVPGAGLLALAALGWVVLTPLVIRRLPGVARGEWFMLVVATESVAALAAAIAGSEHSGWLAIVALLLAALGLAIYPAVVVRFDLREIAFGKGDQWVAGGSIAISALAFAQVYDADVHLARLHELAGLLRHVAFALWIAGMAWLLLLLLGECIRPRTRYELRRWATVFPLGMYAVCSFKVSSASGLPVVADFARGWVWVAAAGWAVVSAGALASGARSLRTRGRSHSHGALP